MEIINKDEDSFSLLFQKKIKKEDEMKENSNDSFKKDEEIKTNNNNSSSNSSRKNEINNSSKKNDLKLVKVTNLDKKKEIYNYNFETINDLHFQEKDPFDDRSQYNYPQKKTKLPTLPHLIKGITSPFSLNEKNNKIVSNLLANYHPKKEGIFAHDAHFIFAVSLFIITAIIVAFILLINYNDLYLQKEEEKMNEDKEKYLISFQKSHQLDSYLFYIGIGFTSISVFVLSLLAVKNIIFPNSDLKENKI